MSQLMNRNHIRSALLVNKVWLAAGLAVITAIAVFSAAAASGHAESVITFNPVAGELPEGVAVDKTGNVFLSLSPLGQLAKVEPGSNSATLFGSVPGLVAGDFGLLGLAVDAPGNVYGAVQSGNPAAQGVWKFDRKSGAESRVSGTENILLPNSVTFDKRGDMYVTDTILGAIWKVPKKGSASVWIQDSSLEGTGDFGFGFPIGANGIAVRQNVVYASVTETSSIVTVPIMPDGSAGGATLWAQLPDTEFPDGIALSAHGDMYVAMPFSNSVIRVDSDGSVSTVADVSDGLDAPSSVAFGTSHGDRRSLYTVNFSVALAPPGGAGPALVRIDVGELGMPLP